MKSLLNRLLERAQRQGFGAGGGITLAARDLELTWVGGETHVELAGKLVERCDAMAVMIGTPPSPYRELFQAAGQSDRELIAPNDSETGGFLKDLPIVRSMAPAAICQALARRPAAILPDGQITAIGRFWPDEAVVAFGAACFAVFVKSVVDRLRGEGDMGGAGRLIGELVEMMSPPSLPLTGQMIDGPFSSDQILLEAMVEAGKIAVTHHLVDSFFGNLSVKRENRVFISQTGAALDELLGSIDCVVRDQARSDGVTASSELPAHLAIYDTVKADVVLHGHPRFAVIGSLCSSLLPVGRNGNPVIAGCEVVAGHVGAGPGGLWTTVPAAIGVARGAIVGGHGLFLAGKDDFRAVLVEMAQIEQACHQWVVDRL